MTEHTMQKQAELEWKELHYLGTVVITTPNSDTCLYKTEMKSAKVFQ